MSTKPTIKNVWQKTREKLWEQAWKVLITFMVVGAFCVFLVVTKALDVEDAVLCTLYAVFAHVGFLWRGNYRKFHHQFMSDFAVANNLKYQAEGSVQGRHGKLFKHLEDGHLFSVISGTVLGLSTDLFNYTYESGTGRSSVAHTVTALQITFSGLVPHFSVIERNETIDSILRPRNGQYTHELEGDFFKHYKLYITDNQEIEILEILTPEIMAFMIDEAKHFSFEFVENQLFIYQNSYITDDEELMNFVKLARMLLERLQKRIGRLHDDVRAIRSVTDRV